MIEIIDVNKAFGENILFKNYKLTIQTGEFVVISGESGSGKTTLLNMIGSLEKADGGIIKVDGVDIGVRKNQLSYFSQKVGFLFQNFVLIEDKSVYDDLNIIKKNNRSDITIEEALIRVGLENKIHNIVYTLSGGEQQRVALARLMIKKCSVILADEPTGSLDKRNADIVMDILKQLNEDGKTVVIVTHDEDIKKRGDRVVEL